MNYITLVGGQRLFNVHNQSLCQGRPCCIHHPSNHHMQSWHQNYRMDTGGIERICDHGIGHPDPDDPYRTHMHGCDGCCIPPGPLNREEMIDDLKKIASDLE